MEDFCPNLEDGERWLPSDIYKDITAHEAVRDSHACTLDDDERSRSAYGISNGGGGGDWIVGKQSCSRIRHAHGDERRRKTRGNNSKGTGVFLPCLVAAVEVPRLLHEGTGVFLPSFSSQGNGNSKMKEQPFLGEEIQGKKIKDSFQVSSQICLPQEWTY